MPRSSNAKVTLRKRKKLYNEQDGLCCYCESPMWILTTKDQTVQKHIIRLFKKKHGIDHNHARKLRCTIEHLVCKKDGGTNAIVNLAAACLHCNSVRADWGNDATPDDYKQLVIRRMKRGTWFTQFNPLKVFDYTYKPSVIDVVLGVLARQFTFNKPWVKRMHRRYRAYQPQRMSRVQIVQSFIRTHC